MSIVGHGVDIIEIARVQQLFQRHGERFLARVYTPTERNIIAAAGKMSPGTMAGRFAAKEAVLKALGTGWSGDIGWTDVEIAALDTGQPIINLTGEAARIARQMGVDCWHISISHNREHAMASAIAEGNGGETYSSTVHRAST